MASEPKPFGQCAFCQTFTTLDHADFWCYRCYGDAWKIRTQVERLIVDVKLALDTLKMLGAEQQQPEAKQP